MSIDAVSSGYDSYDDEFDKDLESGNLDGRKVCILDEPPFQMPEVPSGQKYASVNSHQRQAGGSRIQPRMSGGNLEGTAGYTEKDGWHAEISVSIPLGGGDKDSKKTSNSERERESNNDRDSSNQTEQGHNSNSSDCKPDSGQ